jgi:nucleoside 2-deoxyribosyltransferase
MMVDIRAAAFVVADLTGASAGAYWEAGFASGLGRPVIYTCEESSFSDSHFDTNHHVTIKWSAASPERAASDLKAMIRNALPDRAKMTDD